METPHFCALGIKLAMHAAKKRQSLIHVQQSSMLLVCHVHKTWQLAAIRVSTCYALDLCMSTAQHSSVIGVQAVSPGGCLLGVWPEGQRGACGGHPGS